MYFTQLSYIDRASKYRAFETLLKAGWAMLLDSGSRGRGENSIDTGVDNENSNNAENYRRYDIFVCDPTLKLTQHKDHLTLEDSVYTKHSTDYNRFTALEQDPLDYMRKLLAEFKPQGRSSCSNDELDEIPFTGGWLGYISYDFGLQQEVAIKYSNREKLADSVDVPEIRMGLYQWALITDHQEQTSRIYNFGLNHDDFDSLSNRISEHISTNLESGDRRLAAFNLTSGFQSNLSKQAYAQGFDRIQKYIHAGDCYQVNFAQQFSAYFDGCGFQIYQKLAQENNAPFSAYLNFGDQQILSLSPERFIESHQGKVKTQPIKGTRPRDNDPIKDDKLADELINSEKDRAENLMIVDLLRNDLSKTASKGSVKVRELFGLYRFQSVHHLVSTVTSKLDPRFDNFDLLATTLPGGSVTGAPKIRAMQIIDELETFKRGIYCGVIGYLDFHGNMDTNICIRTLIADKNKLYCYAGGGIVSDSQMALEYQESFDKLNKILPVLNQYFKS